MPTTTNRKFSIPTTGTEVGVWGSNDINPNFSTLDGILGSVTTLNLAGSGPVTLNDAQQQVAVIRMTGILTGNVAVTVAQPAFWIIDNQTSGNFVVTIGGASGNLIATPQGSRYEVAYDGTNAFFVNLGKAGVFEDWCVTAVPSWVTSCTVNPYLACVGGTFPGATYPALAAMLGTTFGGNGITTFGLPDLRGRSRFALDASAGRLSSATMTPDGNTISATGGQQNSVVNKVNLAAFSLNVTDTGHTHSTTTTFWNSGQMSTGAGATGQNLIAGANAVSSAFTGITVASGGSGTPMSTMPPAMVTGITLIKT